MWDGVFSADRIRESAQAFEGKTHGFTKTQREWAAQFFFCGVMEGAKASRDTDLERLVRGWIAGKLRPLGYSAAVAEIGLGKGKVCVAQSGDSSRPDGSGQSAA